MRNYFVLTVIDQGFDIPAASRKVMGNGYQDEHNITFYMNGVIDWNVFDSVSDLVNRITELGYVSPQVIFINSLLL